MTDKEIWLRYFEQRRTGAIRRYLDRWRMPDVRKEARQDALYYGRLRRRIINEC